MYAPVALSGDSELQCEHYITWKTGASYQTLVETKSSLSKRRGSPSSRIDEQGLYYLSSMFSCMAKIVERLK
jgi:hypothetical protein